MVIHLNEERSCQRLVSHFVQSLLQNLVSNVSKKFEEGDFVLVFKRPVAGQHNSLRLSSDREGPYVIEQVIERGAYQLIDHQGNMPMPPVNGRFLRKYHV